jgi:hypothetical protein
MEFLDINLTKDSLKTRVFCSMLFMVLSFSEFQRKPYSSLVSKNLTKNPAKQENFSLFKNSTW